MMARSVYSVKQLNQEIRNLLESSYRTIWVEGELSSVSTPSSGHIYFSLKEENALIRCAYFRNRQVRNSFIPVDGLQVLVSGQVSFYGPRGDLQLIVTFMEEAGEGALRRAFEALKKKLAEEGLFDSAHKQPIPAMPGKIGLVTSAGSAALHDMVVTLKRRFPVAGIIVYPVMVQGEKAPQDIVSTLAVAQERAEVDILVLARGGGSMEDLQAFNEEQVARAIYKCQIPVVTGIGHETDFSIADLVADQRAATPTAAAELVTPDFTAIRQEFSFLADRIQQLAQRILSDRQQSLDYMSTRVVHPAQALKLVSQHKAHLSQRLVDYAHGYINATKYRVESNQQILRNNSPESTLVISRQCLQGARKSLWTSGMTTISALQQQVLQVREKLTLMNPHNTLERGYAIVQDKTNQVVTSTSTVYPGQSLKIRVADGTFGAKAD